MKKLFLIPVLAFMFSACENKKSTHEDVISTDTVGVTYDVEKTVVETDTTIDVDTVTRDKEIEVEKK